MEELKAEGFAAAFLSGQGLICMEVAIVENTTSAGTPRVGGGRSALGLPAVREDEELAEGLRLMGTHERFRISATHFAMGGAQRFPPHKPLRKHLQAYVDEFAFRYSNRWFSIFQLLAPRFGSQLYAKAS